ncbi:MAG: phosphonate ABC transporter, permease protein PhnE [Tissierellia bacterium]|nr:phosphonate ABC transporter, permease protein PhnE [Tissierellia bacterium]
MTEIEKYLKNEPNYRLAQGLLTGLTLMVLVWSSDVIDFSNYTGDGGQVVASILGGILSPDLSLLANFSRESLWYLVFETVCIAFVGTLVGALVSLPLAFLSSPKMVPWALAEVFKILIMVIRTIPAIVYGLMFIRVTGPGPFAGVMTMTFTSVGMLTKLFQETIADIDRSILEALESMGVGIWGKIRFGILPQLFSSFLSTIIYRFDMNIRDATTLGLVGAGGIGAPLIFAINAYRWQEVGVILLLLIILVLVVEYLSTKLRKKLAYG